MEDLDLSSLFAGVNDERLISELLQRIRRARNDAQCTFCAVWEATELLNGDGFEMLLEQRNPMEGYAQAFVIIGMPQVKPIFDRVLALIPVELRSPENEDALFVHIRGLSDELNILLHEFFVQSKDIVSVISQYVREHQADFAEYVNG
jgi:hypothetical protein